MSEYDKGKFYGRKKMNMGDKAPFGRSFFNSKTPHKYEREQREGEKSDKIKGMKQPTILLKSREHQDSRPLSPKPQKENETSVSIVSTTNRDDSHSVITEKDMQRSIKLLQDGSILSENVQDFLQENNDFLIIGVAGKQGVGKSTVLNLLAQSKITDDTKKELFNQNYETSSDNSLKPNKNKCPNVFKTLDSLCVMEKNLNVTSGIDFYVTDNRIMFLDCQPLGSPAILEDLIQNENKRLNVVGDFLLLEGSEEIQGLQLLAFLLSVCHVVIFVQDYFFDSNIIRYFLSAEMLKPTISSPEDEYVDHFPHLILLHNKAQTSDFSPTNFRKMQQMYNHIFSKSKCHIKSKLGLSSYLTREECADSINLFLIPEYNENTEVIYNGHSSLESLIKKLRSNILGSTKYPLTHVQLNEKNWLIYCTKVWDHIKKSNFFVEYNKLLP